MTCLCPVGFAGGSEGEGVHVYDGTGEPVSSVGTDSVIVRRGRTIIRADGYLAGAGRNLVGTDGRGSGTAPGGIGARMFGNGTQAINIYVGGGQVDQGLTKAGVGTPGDGDVMETEGAKPGLYPFYLYLDAAGADGIVAATKDAETNRRVWGCDVWQMVAGEVFRCIIWKGP